jgi:hypothetical protein
MHFDLDLSNIINLIFFFMSIKEQLYIRPQFKAKSNTQSALLKPICNPDFSIFDDMSEKYRKYLGRISGKIDRIC